MSSLNRLKDEYCTHFITSLLIIAIIHTGLSLGNWTQALKTCSSLSVLKH